ncbi:hypothetical protein P7C71_g2048, partial [Lecanoromycetidae sp. Uapishka_2]
MDFLKKAKAQLKELEGDLNKATASLGLGEKHPDAPDAQAPMGAAPESSASTPAASNMNTPATSVAPSTVPDAPKTKLPLAIRKEVRDVFEAKLPDQEAKLSSVLGVPWKTSIDPGYIYTFAKSRYTKDQPGHMLHENVGEDGKNELNNLASAHILTIEPDEKGKISYCGSEISGGWFRILFNKEYLGSNMRDSTAELGKTINEAGIATSGSGGAALDFNAKQAIKKDYEPGIGAIEARIAKAIAAPVITLHPNFEANFAKIAAYTATGKQSTIFPREWQKNIGNNTLAYFRGLADKLEENGFSNDEMLQEGFKDAVEKNEVSLRVVDQLSKSASHHYNESIIEGGVFYMQTTPEYWTTNIRDTASEIMNLL